MKMLNISMTQVVWQYSFNMSYLLEPAGVGLVFVLCFPLCVIARLLTRPPLAVRLSRNTPVYTDYLC
jgi:hypothetical protein